MKINERYDLLNRLGLIGDTLEDFEKRVKMNGGFDEAYNGGMWDLAYEIIVSLGIDPFDDNIDIDNLQDLLYNLLKY